MKNNYTKQQIEEILDIFKGLITEEEFYQWYDSLTPEQLEEYNLTGRVTK